MPPAPPTENPPAIALIICRVLEEEVAALTRDATHVVRREYFEMGLHDHPADLRQRLAGAIERAETDPAVRAVVLVYGLCGLALVNLSPRRCPLVVARAHDCLTLFLGSKERYAGCMQRTPGFYWYSPGWIRGKRVPGPERDAELRREYTAKYGAENAEALLEMERAAFAQHTTAGYTDHRLPGDDEHRRHAERCAAALGWTFEYLPGEGSLLHDLVFGPWDDRRFLIVPPGRRVAHTADDAIIAAVP